MTANISTAVSPTAVIPPPSLGRPGLTGQLRALGAVAWREWLIFVRYPTWVVGLLIWPVIFPAAYLLSARALIGPDGSGLALFAAAAGTADYVSYIAIGTTVWMWQNISLWQVGLALRSEQMRGTLESNWLTPANRLWFLLGSGITQGFVLMVFIFIAALEFGLLFGVRLNGNPWLVLLVFAAAAPSIYGLGFAFASIVLAAREANAFVFLVRGLVMVFCGISYPLSVLPDWMRAVAAWLPPTYVIRGMRAAALNNASLAELMPDLLALAGFGALWLTLGYLAFGWMERRTRRSGALNQY
jgi:ABC-2 type transport system permease protein